jgi:hypothetical protein
MKSSRPSTRFTSACRPCATRQLRVEQLESRLVPWHSAYVCTTFATSLSLGTITATPVKSDDPEYLSWGDVRMYSFKAAADQTVSFSVKAGHDYTYAGDLQTVVRVFQSDGTELVRGSGPINYQFKSSDTFYVGVSLPGNTDYDPITGDGWNYINDGGDFLLTVSGQAADKTDIAMRDAAFAGDRQHVQFHYTVKPKTFQSAFQVGLYYSADKTFDPSDAEIERMTLPAPGSTTVQEGGFNLSTPTVDDPEKPYLLVVADPDSAISETNKKNNVVVVSEVEITSVIPKLASVAAAGEADAVKVLIKNGSPTKITANGGTPLIKIYSGPDKKYLFAEYDVPSGTTQTLNPGQSRTFNIKFNFPAVGDPNAIDPGTYTYYVELDPAWKGKTGSSADPFDYVLKFGTVGDRKDVKLSVNNGGTKTLFSIKGKGTGTLALNGGVADLSFENTDMGTQVDGMQTTAGAAPFPIRNISAASDIGKVSLRVDATGTLAFAGQLGQLLLQSLSGSLTCGTGNDGAASQLLFNALAGATINAKDGIAWLMVQQAGIAASSPSSVTTKFINKLDVGYDFNNLRQGRHVPPLVEGTGDITLNLTLNGGPDDADGVGLGAVDVRGMVTGTWSVGELDPQEIGTIKVGGATDWDLGGTNAGPLKSLKVGEGGWHNNPTLFALFVESIGTMDIEGPLDVPWITVSGADQRNVAIKELNLKTVNHVGSFLAKAGGIRDLTIGTAYGIPGSVLETAWIGDLTANFLDLTLNLDGVRPKTNGLSLGQATVNGLLGTWNVFANIGAIDSHAVTNLWTLNGASGPNSPGTNVGQIRTRISSDGSTIGDFKGTLNGVKQLDKFNVAGDFTGSIQTSTSVGQVTVGRNFAGTFSGVKQLDKLQVAGDFNGTIQTTGPVDQVKVDGTFSGTLDSAGPIGLIAAANWDGGGVTAPMVESVNVKNTMANTHLYLTGPGESSLTAGAINTVDIGGGLNGANLLPTPAGFARITAPFWQFGRINAAYIKSLSLPSSDASHIGLGQVSVTLNGQPKAGQPSLGNFSSKGAVSNSTFNLAHGAGPIEVGAMTGTTQITTTEDIASLIVSGNPKTSGVYFHATVSARNIGTVVVHDVDTTDQSAFGIAASWVGSYTRYVGKDLAKHLVAQTNGAGVVDDIPGSGYALDII